MGEIRGNGIFGEELIAGKMTEIEWLRPVYADDVLTGRVSLEEKTRRNKYNGEIALRIDIFNQYDDLVLSNITKTVVKCRKEE